MATETFDFAQVSSSTISNLFAEQQSLSEFVLV